MRVSVVIPTFNSAKTVVNAIRSVLEQSTPPFEILVVDDGSADDTKAAVKRFGDRVKYIYQENSGASAARNAGVRASCGDWVAFLDADDTWAKDKLRIQCKAIVDYSVLCCLGAHLVDNKIIKCHDPGLVEDCSVYYEDPMPLMFSTGAHPLLQSMLVQRSVIDRLGPMDETLKVAEDTKFIYQVLRTFPCVYVSTPLFSLTRVRSTEGLSDQSGIENRLRRYECYFQVQNYIYGDLLIRGSLYAENARRNACYFASRIAELHAVLGNNEMARLMAWHSLSCRGKCSVFFRSVLIYFFPSGYCRLRQRHLVAPLAVVRN